MNFFHWDGKPLLHPGLLDNADRTRSYTLEDGSTVAHPDVEDYEAALRAGGRLGSGESLVERADLVAACQAHWHAEKCNSCVFSAYLSRERVEHGWETFVVVASGPSPELAEGIEGLVGPAIRAPATEIVSVVLPSLVDELELALLIDRLGTLPDWELVELGEEEDAKHGPATRLGLRRTVELGYQSEVLGFGPQPLAARTRQAPFTELAIRSKPPPRFKAHRRAVMADVRLPAVSGGEAAQWGAETKTLREQMLGASHDLRGKAKVSFVISKAIWQEARA
jgi:hypothetical protein